MELDDIPGNGKLQIKTKEGAAIDIAGQINKADLLDTRIIVDNKSPVVTFTQTLTEDGKVIATLEADEEIHEVEGWKISANRCKLTKEFDKNETYSLTLTDYAWNETQVEISITKVAKENKINNMK